MKKATKAAKVSQVDVEKMLTNDITVREQNAIFDRVVGRMDYIMRHITTSLYCWDYGDEGTVTDYRNCSWSNGNEVFLEPYGEFLMPAPYDCGSGFPERWLWEDFEVEFAQSVERANKEEKAKQLKRKNIRLEFNAKRETMIEKIKSKLTSEELKFVTFVNRR